jgi:single-stranded DNA-specific DHH superfamily exonuclease
MKLASKYQRPTLVVRTDDFGIAKGSARGVNNSKLTSLKDYLEST